MSYSRLGYADESQWGLFNPPQSLFKSDPTLYGSLFATNRDQEAEEGGDYIRAKERARQHPGLPNEVGPRKAWKRSGAASLYAPTGTNPKKGLAYRGGGLSGYGQAEEKSTVTQTAIGAGLFASPLFILLAIIIGMKLLVPKGV